MTPFHDTFAACLGITRSASCVMQNRTPPKIATSRRSTRLWLANRKTRIGRRFSVLRGRRSSYWIRSLQKLSVLFRKLRLDSIVVFLLGERRDQLRCKICGADGILTIDLSQNEGQSGYWERECPLAALTCGHAHLVIRPNSCPHCAIRDWALIPPGKSPKAHAT